MKRDITSSSYTYHTGKMMLTDTAGRVDKFKKRFAKHAEMKNAAPAAPEAKEEKKEGGEEAAQ